MLFFNFNFKKVALALFLIVIPLWLLTTDRQSLEQSFLFQTALFVTTSVQKSYHFFTSQITHTTHTYLNLVHTRKTNQKLQKENQKLKTLMALFEEVRQENTRLRTMIQFTKKAPFQLLAAQVVGRDPFSSNNLLTINRGSRQGVKKKMTVVGLNTKTCPAGKPPCPQAQSGFVGYIFRVQAHSSQVMLLTNPSAAVPVRMQNSRIHSILEGSGARLPRLKYLKHRDPVQTGDLIVTADSHPFPVKGFPVGTVDQVQQKDPGQSIPSLSKQVSVKPFIDFSRLEEVFIVIPPSQEASPQ